MNKKCKSCGEEVNKSAKKCKHCGSDQRNWFIRHWFISSVLVIVALVAIGNAGSEKTPEVKEYVSISCADFSSKFGLKSELSDLQKDELFDNEYKNKWIKWEGMVTSIGTTFGQLQMQVKCLPETFVSDVIVSFDDSEKDKLLSVKEKQQVKFEGQLSFWGELTATSIRKGKLNE